MLVFGAYLPVSELEAADLGYVPFQPPRDKRKATPAPLPCTCSMVHACRNGTLLPEALRLDGAEEDWRLVRMQLASAQTRLARGANTLPAEEDYAARLDGWVVTEPVVPPPAGW